MSIFRSFGNAAKDAPRPLASYAHFDEYIAMNADRVLQLILSALSLVLFAPVFISHLSYIEMPLLMRLILLAISILLLISAWATKPSFREKLMTELPWLFPDGK